MAAGQLPLKGKRGDDFSKGLHLRNADGTDWDLTNYTDFLAQMREDSESEVVAATFDIDDSQKSTGRLVLSLPAAVTATLTGQYFWDLQWTTPNGKIQTVLEGPYLSEGDISHV